MKKLFKYTISGMTCVLLLTFVGTSTASELVWAPINPSFTGGLWYNAQWLMSSAQAQNRHVKSTSGYRQTNPMEDFTNNLNRQLFSRLTSKILDEAFGEETTVPLQAGQYVVGDYTMDITTNGGITVVITDNITVNQTTVTVPYY